jgi:hypothetical protein
MHGMQAPLPRRAFLKLFGQLGVACCCSCRLARAADEAKPKGGTLPDLKSRAHCGLLCNDRCPLFKATVANDTAAKEKIFREWGWQEKYGMEFDAAKVFCHGCKPGDRPLNISESRCTVRACSRERGLESCLQCRQLAACDKDLWKSWPKLKQQAEKWQQEYLAAGSVQLA